MKEMGGSLNRLLVFVSLGFVSSAGERKNMKKIKFVVKLSRGDVRSPEFVQRIDRVPIQMTTNRKLALLMGRFTAEDAIKSIQTSRCIPELVSVRVGA